MKLENLAPYLPYKLKMKSPHGFRPNGKESTGVSGIVFLTGDLYADIENNTFKREKFIPILCLLSDLTKEIEHNGEKFVPCDKLHLRAEDMASFLNKDLWIGKWLSYEDIIKLLEWHFDVFGLIKKGEAIDINTL